jgi:hypothetical protein
MPTLPTLPTNAHAPKFVGNVGNLFSIAHIAHKMTGHMATRPGARMRSRATPGARGHAARVGNGGLPTACGRMLATLELDANGNHLQLRGWAGPLVAGVCTGGFVQKFFLFFSKHLSLIKVLPLSFISDV